MYIQQLRSPADYMYDQVADLADPHLVSDLDSAMLKQL